MAGILNMRKLGISAFLIVVGVLICFTITCIVEDEKIFVEYPLEFSKNADTQSSRMFAILPGGKYTLALRCYVDGEPINWADQKEIPDIECTLNTAQVKWGWDGNAEAINRKIHVLSRIKTYGDALYINTPEKDSPWAFELPDKQNLVWVSIHMNNIKEIIKDDAVWVLRIDNYTNHEFVEKGLLSIMDSESILTIKE